MTAVRGPGKLLIGTFHRGLFFWALFCDSVPSRRLFAEFRGTHVIAIAFSTGGVIFERFPPPSVELGGPPKLS